MHLGNLPARGILIDGLKYCWLQVLGSMCQSNEVEHEIKRTPGEDKLGEPKNPGKP